MTYPTADSLYESCYSNEQWRLQNIQTFYPIIEKCFKVNHTEENIKKLSFETRYILERLKRIKNSNYYFEMRDSNTNKTTEIETHIKTCHLLDPIKYMMDYYSSYKKHNLPYLRNQDRITKIKIQDPNNKAYVDSFFCLLASKLVENNVCPHFPIFYGQFIGNDKEYLFDLTDEFYSIRNTKWFHKNFNNTFRIAYNENQNLKVLSKEELQIESDVESLDDNDDERDFCVNDSDLESIDDCDLHIENYEQESIDSSNNTPQLIRTQTPKSTQNSRKNRSESDDNESDETDGSDDSDEYDSDDSNESSDSDDCDDENKFFCILKEFPVMITIQEKCIGVLEDLCNENPQLDIWGSYLFQIVFSLAITQYYFDFTHNDLHCNNIMYQRTDKKYLYYKIANTYFRIPTNGVILKIIDFGRSIYKVKDRLYVSDDFQQDNDAGGQYNFSPYYNPKYKKVLPNKSFDLCRLATSIFELLFPDPEKYPDAGENPLYDILVQWLTDKHNKSVLFNERGEERYKDFDLYKVIARRVFNAVPKKQFGHPLFSQFQINKENIPEEETVYSLQ